VRRSPPPRPTVSTDAMARPIALFLGGFTLLNLLGGLLRAGYDQTILWIDLRALPAGPARLALLVAALLLVGLAVRPPRSGWRRIVTGAALVALVLGTAANTAGFYAALHRGEIRPLIPVPLSLLFAAALLIVLVSLGRPVRRVPAWRWVAGVLAIVVGFPLAQMVFFGGTDYRRPADAVVVLGARAYADGRPSLALADRVRTACDLHAEGLVEVVVVSGGPGDGATHETEAMRALAIELGVPAEAVVVDDRGVNTMATAANASRLADRRGWTRLLAVSHAFHLPRVKMAFAREGRDVSTVPARETRPLRSMPYLLAREVVAFWWYWGTTASPGS
jgi:uncharacterized SAM-binding protein YcdF (DUF218 family)